MSTNESFIKFTQCIWNIGTVEEIICSNKLKINNEDTLMIFLINIYTKNEERNLFIHLFEHVFWHAEGSFVLLKKSFHHTA